MKRAFGVTFVGMMVVMLTSGAQAAPLTGTFSFTGTEDVRVGADYIDWGWFDDQFGPPDGEISFLSGSGSFAGLAGTLGTILDLNIATAPVESPLDIPNFITSNANPTWNFTLTRVYQGTGNVGCAGVVGVGETCTPFLGSPFSIKNEPGGGSSVSLSMAGTVMDLVGPASIWNGIFTTQFTDLNASELVALVESQGFAQSSYSAQVGAEVGPEVVPEPASLMLLGTGLVAVASRLRRRR